MKSLLKLLTWKIVHDVQAYDRDAHILTLISYTVPLKIKCFLTNTYTQIDVLLLWIYWFHSSKCYALSKKTPTNAERERKEVSTEMIICHLFSTHAQIQAVTILKCIDGPTESGTGLTTIHKFDNVAYAVCTSVTNISSWIKFLCWLNTINACIFFSRHSPSIINGFYGLDFKQM